MFDSLAEKLQATLAEVRGRGTLTEDDINAVMREIRLALLEADVNFKVVKSFTNAVKERALAPTSSVSSTPVSRWSEIVSDELTELMGGSARELSFSPRPPTIVLMAGLQGSGKTTATAKLAGTLREEHNSFGGGGRLRRVPAGGGRAADQGRRAGRRRRLRAGHGPQTRSDRQMGGRPGPYRGQGCAESLTPAAVARRHGADDRAGRHQESHRSPRTSCWSSTP